MIKSLGIDCDDVLLDLESYKVWFYHRHDIAAFNPDNPEHQRLKSELYNNVELSIEGMQFKEGAVKVITTLLNLGVKIKVVTRRGLNEALIPKKLLELKSIEIPIISVGSKDNKLSFVEGCDAFVDDDPKHLIPMIGLVPKLFLMTNTTNKVVAHPELTKIDSWQDLLNHLLQEQ